MAVMEGWVAIPALPPNDNSPSALRQPAVGGRKGERERREAGMGGRDTGNRHHEI